MMSEKIEKFLGGYLVTGNGRWCLVPGGVPARIVDSVNKRGSGDLSGKRLERLNQIKTRVLGPEEGEEELRGVRRFVNWSIQMAEEGTPPKKRRSLKRRKIQIGSRYSAHRNREDRGGTR